MIRAHGARQEQDQLMNIIRRAVLAVLILGLHAPAWAATVSIPASRDNTIYQSAPNNSAGGGAGIFIGTNAAASPRRGLIAFDVAANVPAGATVTSAGLTMYLGTAANSFNTTIGLHRLNADWGEGTAGSSNTSLSGGGNGFAAATGDATWNARFHSPTTPTAWSAPGANGDFNAGASASALISLPTPTSLDIPFTWGPTPALVSDVQNWLNSPASNFGWALVNTNETAGQSVRVFYSSEATLNSNGAPLDPAWRPALTVTYVIPEPSALMIVTVAATFVLGCRRR
jgi:hypothetical protein